MGNCCHLAVAGDVFVGVFLCCPFSHEMSLMRYGTRLSQFLRDFLPTLTFEELFIAHFPTENAYIH